MAETTTEHSIDITDLICPMTFVRTKLKLEKISPGDVLHVRLKGEEPFKNVPRSATQHGHTVLSTRQDDSSGEDGVFIVSIRREDV